MHSAFAVIDAKEIMGHCSLNYENRNDRIAEMALAFAVLYSPYECCSAKNGK
jgi:hypothetical protein